MCATAIDGRISSVRRFNRFYTEKIGVLDEGLLHSPFSLAEARVLYELAHRDRPTASQIARDLHLDPGYLSRMLRGFRRRDLIERASAAADGRRRHLSLTAAGRAAFAPLDARSREEIGELIGGLPDTAQARLVGAMQTIEMLLTPAAAPGERFALRAHRPGDMGWIVGRHGEQKRILHDRNDFDVRLRRRQRQHHGVEIARDKLLYEGLGLRLPQFDHHVGITGL